jgi:hypothetical protein
MRIFKIFEKNRKKSQRSFLTKKAYVLLIETSSTTGFGATILKF